MFIFIKVKLNIEMYYRIFNEKNMHTCMYFNHTKDAIYLYNLKKRK